MTPNPESALNEDAGKMILDDFDGFTKKAKLLATIHAGASPIKADQENTSSANPISRKTATLTSSLSETRRKLRRL
ncbi:hypothetical protein PSACC_01950 [Paramicrosporidium saccamoebae]|uniref:Uncharacterized protein n=1 Tax=Paramicrosporidium saccamoebae TaxID=1246581 RepID=A0A2H9TKJ7_9FUNG|nr:hypothetical protein PSACC_01950 [Paramicrosporidium saccamoebae]